MKYPRIMQSIFGTPWAIDEGKLHAIVEFMNHAAFDGTGPSAEYSAASRPPSYKMVGSTAVIPIYDTIVPRANLMTAFSGGTSVDVFRNSFRSAMNDNEISTILLDFATPGGSVYQVQEMAEEIRMARSQKPVIAQVSTMAASAGYWWASAASQINITPSGEAGSIGVIAMHVDWSEANKALGINPTYITAGKYKSEGNPNEPLSDDAISFLEKRVDEYYQSFISDVALGRGVSADVVRETYGQGRVFGAADALRIGMVDKIATMDQTLEEIRSKDQRSKRKSTARTMRARAEFPAQVV